MGKDSRKFKSHVPVSYTHLSKAETLRQEWKEHKECADELERNVEEVHRFVQTE